MEVSVNRLVFPDRKSGEVEESFLAKLQESLKEDGLKVPVLVTDQLVVIDGRSRVLAAAAIGWETIKVEVAEDYETMIDNLTRAHHDSVRSDLTPRRTWEIYQDSKDLMTAYTMRIRRLTASQRIRHHKTKRLSGNPLPAALGVSANTLQAIRMVYRTAETDDGALGKWCREEVARIDAGNGSIGTALHKFRDRQRKVEGAVDIKTQRAVLGKILVHLKSIDSALGSLGPLSEEATTEEIDEWLQALYVSNTTLFRLRAALRKERESK